MKLTSIFLLFAAIQVMGLESYSQETKFSLNFKSTSLKEVMSAIEDESDYYFLYSSAMIDVDRIINVNIEKGSISEVLDRIFKETGIQYDIKGRQILLSKENNFWTGLQETVPVSGKVTDSSGFPLPGVTVVIKGTTQGTTTDNSGNYSLANISGNATLVFSFIGLKTQEVSVSGRSRIDVVMEGATIGLDEVVAIGYGTQSRTTLSTAIAKVDTTVLKNTVYTNMAQALQGTAPGVMVQSTSGQPGVNPRVIIRGGTSINHLLNSTPLYVVDGFIWGNLDDINSNDIESIQVLKDAAATAIYGAQGSNGVVLITTKKGKAGQTEFTYKYNMTLSELGKSIEMANAHDFIYYGRLGYQRGAKKNEAYLQFFDAAIGLGTGNDLTKKTFFTTQYLTPDNEYKLNEGWESMPDPIDPSKTIIYKDTNWKDVLFRTGISHDHYIAARGGTDKAKFSAGLGYNETQGIAITTHYKRLSLNLSGELKVRDNLKVFSQVMYTSSTNNQVYDDYLIFTRGLGMAPTTKYTFEDGTLAPGEDATKPNVAYFLQNHVAKKSNDHLTMILGGQWDILPGLSFNPQLTLFKFIADSYFFQPSILTGNGTYDTTRSASSGYNKIVQPQVDAMFSYTRSFASSHNLDLTGGFNYREISNFTLSASGNKAPTDLIPTLNAASTPTGVNGSVSERVLLSYTGRATYDFKQKYMIGMSARYDGASPLGADTKWGFFPGVSLGWNLHKEDFWGSIFPEDLVRLKLRGSYGVNGNISNISDYQAQGAYAVSGKYYGASGIQNSTIPNRDLKWEESRTLDVGMDIDLFKGRINIITDVYRRVTDNLLTSLSLPMSTGFSSVVTNLGSLENKGFEIAVTANVLPATSSVKWQVSFNAASTRNKILELPDNGVENNRIGGINIWDPAKKDYTWQGGYQEGGRIGEMFAFKQLGIYATDEEAADAPEDQLISFSDKTMYGGDVKYLDADGNGILDLKDRVRIGNSLPKWTGGITSSLSYKGFDFYVRMDYMTGHTIYNFSKLFLAGGWALNLNFPKEYATDSWKQPGDIATLPPYVQGAANWNYWKGSEAYGNDTENSTFYEKGDFLCLREVTLAYNVPSSVLHKLRMKGLRFNITGNNLHYFTKYTGLNPEEGGKDYGHYPNPRSISFGATITF